MSEQAPQIGLLSSSLFKIITAHAKSDALLSNLAKANPAAVTMATTTFTPLVAKHFRQHEFQRAATFTFSSRAADRRSLRGSFLLTLDNVIDVLCFSKPYYLRDTMQRPLSANGEICGKFENSSPICDQSKRGRTLDLCTPEDKKNAELHWNMLKELLVALQSAKREISKNQKIPLEMAGQMQTVANDAKQLQSIAHDQVDPMYIEISPCKCSLCSKRNIHPNHKIRLLCFRFVPDLKVIDIVSRRKQKMRAAMKKEKNVAISLSDEDIDPKVVSRVLNRLQTTMHREIERAVDGATNDLRQELSQSNAKVRSLSDQVAWLSDQLALVQLGSLPADTVENADELQRPLKRRFTKIDNSLDWVIDAIDISEDEKEDEDNNNNNSNDDDDDDDDDNDIVAPFGIALSPPLSPLRLSSCRSQVNTVDEWPTSFQQQPSSPRIY